MPRYRKIPGKIPVEIEAIELGNDPMPAEMTFVETPEGWLIYNRLHDSWIKVKKGDMVRIDKAPDDIYPIDREFFYKTYEKVD